MWRGHLRERDNRPITAAHIIMHPRALAIAVFFYVFLVLFRVCLISMIRINAATFCYPEFHVRAMELLLYTGAILNMKDAR
jgi:hypothetical protein